MPSPEQFHRSIVGVVGGAGSGKDTVAEIFATGGYEHVSTSDMVREEIAARGLAASRPLQTSVANELRQQHGAGYWVDLAVSTKPIAENLVLSGLYAPGEGSRVINQYGGTIVGVVAELEDDLDVRFARVVSRSAGDRDQLDRASFEAAHNRENSGIADHETNIGQLLAMARFIIVNNSDMDTLTVQTNQVMSQLQEGRTA